MLNGTSPQFRRNCIRALRVLILSAALALRTSLTFAVDFSKPIAFDIPPQPLSGALVQFADQAGVQFTAPGTSLNGVLSEGVHGEYAPTTALAMLLRRTGLGYRIVDQGTVAITQPGAGTAVSASPAPRTSAGKEGKTGSVSSFQMARAAEGNTSAASASAAPQPAAPGPQSTAAVATLQEVVVTATAMAGGVKLLNASFSVTTASLQQIHQAMPSSSADLLKIVPGLWAESSGGENGPNIELAGFPGGGDAPYVTYQIEGSPVFPASSLSFMDNSSLFRLDDTIERAEVVQGGPSVVYSNGQIGATANFVLRRGTPTPHGELALTLGNEGLYRLDGFYGGPLAADWFVSVGGFYRESNGVRKSQFPADDGGQLTATLYHPMENGNLLFWGRVVNDKNLFITDVPVGVSPNGQNISAFPGFNPLTGTFAGDATRGITVEEFPCSVPGCTPGTITADLADGRGTNVRMFGSDLNLTIGPWLLSNKMGYTAGHMPTNAFFNNFSPETLGTFIASELAATNADTSVMAATGGSPYRSGTATFVANGAPVNPATEIVSLGFWMVDKKIQAFTDDLRFSRDLFPGNTATLGGYFASYSSDDTWYLGNNELMTATQNAQLINLTLNNANGNPALAAQATQNGILSGAFLALVDRYSGRNSALFLSDQWRLGPWLLDAEYRSENETIDGTIEGTNSVDLDGNPLTLYNNGTSVANGPWAPSTFDHTLGSWSAGANYDLTSHMSAYVRVNQGVHFPSFDDLRSGTPLSQHIENYEAGYKAQTSTAFASLSAFHRLFFGVPFQAFLGNGTQVTSTYGATSWGVNFQGDWFPIYNLSFGLTGDWQHSVYTHFSSFAGLAGGGSFDNNGKILQRQPRLQFRFTPEYDLPTSWGELKVFSTVSYIDLRYSDPGDTQVLPAYVTLDAGIVGDFGSHFEVRLQGTNLADTLGLTEGNARTLTAGISTGYEMARPIFGRELQVQLKYLF